MSLDHITVDHWEPQRAQQRAADVFAVYDAVFGDVADEAQWRADSFDRHCARDGFRLAAAEVGGALVGFAYGYLGERGQWWPDQVAAALGPELADVWVGGHFEFVELGVLGSFRRHGIGVRLHDELMRGTEHRRALLGTDDGDTPATALYRSRGWRKLGNLTPETAVLGRWVGSGG
jgi:ribosomal protein S18 acetylase RimI-like enzyme